MMKRFLLPTRLARWWIGRVLPGLLLFAAGLIADARGQSLAKTTDITEDISPDGSVKMAFQLTFDAAPWRQWKTMVGDEPARLRALLRHQFAAYTIENFKLERDDMNRVANMSVRSPVGPQLRDDGAFQVPVDGYFRLINNAGLVWYFSGNNPRAGNSLNSIRITLPANAVNAAVINPNTPDQALMFGLTPVHTMSLWFYVGGAALLLVGLALLLAGLLGKKIGPLPTPAPRALPTPPFRASTSVIDVPPVGVNPAPPPATSAVTRSPATDTRPEHRPDASVFTEPD